MNIRPNFKPRRILEEESEIEEGEVLEPKAILKRKISEKYGMDEVTELSVDLLDMLSLKNIDEAKTLSENFYNEHYAVKDDNGGE